MSLLRNLPYSIYHNLIQNDDWVQKMSSIISISSGRCSGKDVINELDRRGVTVQQFYGLLQKCRVNSSQNTSQVLSKTEKMCTASIKLAILVANANYAHWAPLITPKSDCKILSDILKSMGFLVITLEDVNSDYFRKTIEELGAIIPANAYVLFYFAGHGFELCGTKYMLGIESPSQNYSINNGISENFIIKNGFQNKPELFILLLDMCRKQPDKTLNPDIYLNIPPMEEYKNICNLIIGYATSPYMPSYEKLFISSTSEIQHDSCEINLSKQSANTCCDIPILKESDGIGNQVTQELKSKKPDGVSLYVRFLRQHLKKNEDFIRILEMVHTDFANTKCEQTILQKPQKLDNVAKRFYLCHKAIGDEESQKNIVNLVNELCSQGINATIE